MELVFSKKCLEYSYPNHIEAPKRIQRSIEILKVRGYSIIEPTPALEADLLKVHSAEWIQKVKCGSFLDTDTPGGENIYEYACLSAGGAMMAADKGAFSVMRPPGHHVGRDGRAMGASTLGFCYLNNMAVAVRHLNKRTLILDIDGHHGNGTQEIFLNDPNVVYVSLHGVADYPGTGKVSEGNCLNFPLPAKTGDENYLKTLGCALSGIGLEMFDVIAVSAGFDAHLNEIASLELTDECYFNIGRILRSLDKKVFCVLEGGYSPDVMSRGIDLLIQGLEK